MPAYQRQKFHLLTQYLFILSIITLLIHLPCASGRLLANSSIEMCTGTTHDPGEPPGCKKKLVTRLYLDDIRFNESELNKSVSITQAEDLTIFGKTGKALVDLPPFTISMTNGPIQRQYLMRLQRNYPASYTEEVKVVGDNSSDNLCGSFMRADSSIVERSNGLRCNCSECPRGNCTGTRLEESCRHDDKLLSICLTPSKLQYAGYELRYLEFLHDINVSIRGALTRSLSASGDDGLAFSLNHSDPSQALSVTPLVPPSASVDLESQSQHQSQSPLQSQSEPGLTHLRVTAVTIPKGLGGDLSGYNLFVPVLPVGDPRVRDPRVEAGLEEWILLPPALVSRDGTAFDRVGVGRETWEGGGRETCFAPPGAGYRHQLEDYRAADLDKGAGAAKALVQFLGEFSFRREQEGKRVFLVDSTETQGTLQMSWTMSADELNYALLPSRGAFDYAVVTPSYKKKGESITNRKKKMKKEQYAEGGIAVTITVVPRNTGETGSRFTVVVGNCTDGLVVVGEERYVLDLLPFEARLINFSLNQQAQNQEEKDDDKSSFSPSNFYSCKVKLFDARDMLLARRILSWTGDLIGANNNGNKNAEKREKCSFFDLGCVLLRGSFWQVTLWMLMGLSFCAALFLFIYLLERLKNSGRGLSRDREEEDNMENMSNQNVFALAESPSPSAVSVIPVAPVQNLCYPDGGEEVRCICASPMPSTTQVPCHLPLLKAPDEVPSSVQKPSSEHLSESSK